MNYKRLLVSRKLLDELFIIDPEKGSIRWKEPGNGRRMDQEAGYTNDRGYCMIHIGGKLHYKHRLIWLYTTGKYPKDQIKHKDHNFSNNRSDNLSEETRQEQSFNMAVKQGKNEPKGMCVVHRKRKPHKIYKAYISIHGTKIHLGYHKTMEEAHEAYLTAKKQHHKMSV